MRETRTSDSVGVDEADRDEVVFGIERAPVRHSERLVRHGVADGAPDVDNADASLQETFSIVAEVAVDTLDTGFIGLVNVNTLDWAAE